VYLCYADESGYTGSGHDPAQPVQVMAAILPNAYNFHRSDSEFRNVFDLINTYIPVSELKCEQIYRGRGSWSGVPAGVRDQVIEFYLDWVSSRRHKFIVTAIDNGAFFARLDKSTSDPITQEIRYPYLLAGLHTALVVQKLHRKKARNKGKTILIFDQQDEFADDLTNLVFNPPPFVDEFVPFDEKREKCRLCQIIDTAFFVKSHQSSMAQVVDIVAYLYRLHLELRAYGVPEAYAGEKDKLAAWISQIQDKFVPFSTVYPRKRTPFVEFLNSLKARGV
jgi:hypothetical protein